MNPEIQWSSKESPLDHHCRLQSVVQFLLTSNIILMNIHCKSRASYIEMNHFLKIHYFLFRLAVQNHQFTEFNRLPINACLVYHMQHERLK